MKQNVEHGKKKLATRSISFILALVFLFSIFSGITPVSSKKCEEECGNPYFKVVNPDVYKTSWSSWDFKKWGLCFTFWEKDLWHGKEGYMAKDCIPKTWCTVTEECETTGKEYTKRLSGNFVKWGWLPKIIGITITRCGEKPSRDPSDLIPLIPTCGHIAPSSSVMHNTTIDSTISTALFVIHWIRSESDLNLVLYSPNGTRIDSSVAVTDFSIYYEENTTYEYYVIQNPEYGNWTMEITAINVPSDGEDYCAFVNTISNLTFSLSTDKNYYNPKEQIDIRARLVHDGTPFIGASVTADILRPDNTVDKISLFDDGSHGDAQANDGNYSNIYKNTILEGSYSIIAQASGTTSKGDHFIIGDGLLVQVEILKAKFNDIYSDYGTDTDGDGLYNYLTTDVGVNVIIPGNYSIEGWLYDVNGSEIVWASNSTYLDIGSQSVPLKFYGVKIRGHEVDAPFNLKHLMLYDEKGNSIDYRYSAYTTLEYDYTDFQTLPLKFTGYYSDYGTDTDVDGLYDYLTIDVGVNVSAEGVYSINGLLYDINGNEIVWTSNDTHLHAGPQIVKLNFKGGDIQKHGVDGPYYLKNLTSYDQSWNLLNCILDAYTTSAYNYTDFQKPLAEFTSDYADYGIDTDGDGLCDYLTIDVGVNVITAGDYSLMGYLYDVNGTEIVWSIDYGSLDVGNHTMHLDFDGKTIQMHGVNGPYYLKDLLLSSGENWTFIDYIPDAYNTSAYNYTDFVDPVSTENEVTISGVGLGEIRLIVSFTDTIPVFAGRYSYDLVGINIPQRPNNFTITTSEVKNLKVGVKKIQDNTTRIWITQTIAAPEGIATVQSDLPSPGNYHVKIFGDAADGVSEVDLELTAVKKITASGDFSLSIDISGFPAGKYTVTATADTGCFTDLTLEGLPLVP